jgi:hypothetical protein
MRCNQARTVRVLGPALFCIAFQTGFFSTALRAESDTIAPSGCDALGGRTRDLCLLEFADHGRQIGRCTGCSVDAYLRTPRACGVNHCVQCAQFIVGGVFTN